MILYLGARPFESFQCGDVGDVTFNQYNLEQACGEIKQHYDRLIKNGCKPMTMGGDHTLTYPILQAMHVWFTWYLSILLLPKIKTFFLNHTILKECS